MSNAILNSNVRIPFLAEVEQSLNVINNGTVQYNKNYVGGNGKSLGILVPSYGNTVGIGEDITGDISDIKSGERTVTLVQYHKAVQLSQVEQHLLLSSYDNQVAKPQGQLMASDIQKVAIETLKLGAATASVSTTGKYTDIGEGIANLESSRATGDLFGIMSPKIAKGVVDSGLTFFQADISKSFTTGSIGGYLGATWYKSQDVATNLVIGAYTATTAIISTVGYVAGASTIGISASSLIGTFPKFMGFTVAGVNSVDVFGVDSGLPYVFVMQTNKTAAANAIAAVDIQGVYDSGPLKCVNALPAQNAVVTFIQASASTYTPVICWDKQSFVTATAPIKPLTMMESKPTAGKLMNLLCAVGTDPIKGIDVVRWDVLLGFALILRSLVSVVWIKVA